MPKSPIDRFFDEVLFPKMDEAFDILAQRFFGNPPIHHTGPTPRRRIQSNPSRKKSRVHKAGGGATRAPHPHPRPRPTLTYYDIFEVSPRASVEVIAAAHRVLVKKYHPDTAGISGEIKIRLINAAWEVLQDPVKRHDYDRSIGLR